jgi:glycosyltransferase involved in cell wall biosynthesis
VLALSQGLPVVAARTQTYVELADDDGAAWWFEPGQVDDLRRALERASADRGEAGRMRANASAAAARLRWDDAASAIAPLLAPEVASR